METYLSQRLMYLKIYLLKDLYYGFFRSVIVGHTLQGCITEMRYEY